jgi:N-acetylneuraminate synthase
LERALEWVRAAKEAGADAIKLQTYTADTLTLPCDNRYFRIQGTPWAGRTLHDLYKEACTPWEWHPRLKEAAEREGLDFFSTPFDPTAVDFLEKLGVPAYKVASFELVDIPLIRRIAQTGKPMILSTGMATLEEVREAVEAARGAGAREIVLLKCTSAYPAPLEEMNLRTIQNLREVFGVPVGLSDHTLGIVAAVAAVALGACVVEKHLILDRKGGGADAAFSAEPGEFAEMVRAVRQTEKALGTVRYGPTSGEEATRVFRRSLFVVKDVRRGEVLTAEQVRSIRPGNGLHPRHLDEVLGRRVTRSVPMGTPLTWDLLE